MSGGVSTFWAPVHRVLSRSSNIANAGAPLSAAPSLDFAGSGIQDHRLPYNSRGSSALQPGALGWYAGGEVMVANIVPSAIAAANIAALANAVNGVPMALVGASAAGITVLTAAAPARFQPFGNVVQAGVAIDGLPAVLGFGSNGGFNTSFYNRNANVPRAVSISGVAAGTGGNFTVRGFDLYGQAQTETIAAAAGAGTVNGKKTWKVITSVTPTFTDAHTYSVGTADIFGFGIMASYFGDVRIIYNNAVVTAGAGFLAADATNPATAATGDPRGTYALQSASDGIKRLTMFVTPSLGSMQSNSTTGLFGVTPA